MFWAKIARRLIFLKYSISITVTGCLKSTLMFLWIALVIYIVTVQARLSADLLPLPLMLTIYRNAILRIMNFTQLTWCISNLFIWDTKFVHKEKNVNSLMLSRFRMASCYNWHVRKKSLTAQSTFDTSAVMVEIKIIQWIIFFADYSISDYRNMIENTYHYRNNVLRVINNFL